MDPKKHLRLQFDEPISCGICLRSFPSLEALRDHMYEDALHKSFIQRAPPPLQNKARLMTINQNLTNKNQSLNSKTQDPRYVIQQNDLQSTMHQKHQSKVINQHRSRPLINVPNQTAYTQNDARNALNLTNTPFIEQGGTNEGLLSNRNQNQSRPFLNNRPSDQAPHIQTDARNALNLRETLSFEQGVTTQDLLNIRNQNNTRPCLSNISSDQALYVQNYPRNALNITENSFVEKEGAHQDLLGIRNRNPTKPHIVSNISSHRHSESQSSCLDQMSLSRCYSQLSESGVKPCSSAVPPGKQRSDRPPHIINNASTAIDLTVPHLNPLRPNITDMFDDILQTAPILWSYLYPYYPENHTQPKSTACQDQTNIFEDRTEVIMRNYNESGTQKVIDTQITTKNNLNVHKKALNIASSTTVTNQNSSKRNINQSSMDIEYDVMNKCGEEFTTLSDVNKHEINNLTENKDMDDQQLKGQSNLSTNTADLHLKQRQNVNSKSRQDEEKKSHEQIISHSALMQNITDSMQETDKMECITTPNYPIDKNMNTTESQGNTVIVSNTVDKNDNTGKRKGVTRDSNIEKKRLKCHSDYEILSEDDVTDIDNYTHNKLLFGNLKHTPKTQKDNDSSSRESSQSDSSYTNNSGKGKSSTNPREVHLSKNKKRKVKSKRRVKLYKCDQCSIHFMNEKQLYRHLIQGDHNIEKKHCVICKLKFPKKSVRKHVKRHHMEMNLRLKHFDIITDLSVSSSSDTDSDSSTSESDNDTHTTLNPVKSKEIQPKKDFKINIKPVNNNDDDTNPALKVRETKTLNSEEIHTKKINIISIEPVYNNTKLTNVTFQVQEPEPSTSNEHQARTTKNNMKIEPTRNCTEVSNTNDINLFVKPQVPTSKEKYTKQQDQNSIKVKSLNDFTLKLNKLDTSKVKEINVKEVINKINEPAHDSIKKHALSDNSENLHILRDHEAPTQSTATNNKAQIVVYNCEICDIIFLQPSTWKSHMYHNIHKPKTKTRCQYCGWNFTMKSLKKHIKDHHDEISYPIEFKIVSSGDKDSSAYTIDKLNADLRASNLISKLSKSSSSSSDTNSSTLKSDTDDNTTSNKQKPKSKKPNEIQTKKGFKIHIKPIHNNDDDTNPALKVRETKPLNSKEIQTKKMNNINIEPTHNNTKLRNVTFQVQKPKPSISNKHQARKNNDKMKVKSTQNYTEVSNTSYIKLSAEFYNPQVITSKEKHVEQDKNSINVKSFNDFTLKLHKLDASKLKESNVKEVINKVNEPAHNSIKKHALSDKSENLHILRDHTAPTQSSATKENTQIVVYNCEICDIMFLHPATWRNHLSENIHKPKTRQCPHCGLNFTMKSLKNHITNHHDKISNPIEIKIVSSGDKDSLSYTIDKLNADLRASNLISTSYSKAVYKCRICKVHFITIWALKRHIRLESHHKMKVVICSVCDLSFNKVIIDRHFEIHHKTLNLKTKKDFEVIILPERKSTTEKLTKETDDSIKEVKKVYKVRKLPLNGFKRKYNRISIHELKKCKRQIQRAPAQRKNNSHLNKKYTQQCLKNIKDTVDVDDRLYKCTRCNIHYSKKQYFAWHMTAGIHKIKKRYACPICRYMFSSIFLRKHILVQHFKMRIRKFTIVTSLHEGDSTLACNGDSVNNVKDAKLKECVEQLTGIQSTLISTTSDDALNLQRAKFHTEVNSEQKPCKFASDESGNNNYEFYDVTQFCAEYDIKNDDDDSKSNVQITKIGPLSENIKDLENEIYFALTDVTEKDKLLKTEAKSEEHLTNIKTQEKEFDAHFDIDMSKKLQDVVNEVKIVSNIAIKQEPEKVLTTTKKINFVDNTIDCEENIIVSSTVIDTSFDATDNLSLLSENSPSVNKTNSPSHDKPKHGPEKDQNLEINTEAQVSLHESALNILIKGSQLMDYTQKDMIGMSRHSEISEAEAEFSECDSSLTDDGDSTEEDFNEINSTRMSALSSKRSKSEEYLYNLLSGSVDDSENSVVKTVSEDDKTNTDVKDKLHVKKEANQTKSNFPDVIGFYNNTATKVPFCSNNVKIDEELKGADINLIPAEINQIEDKVYVNKETVCEVNLTAKSSNKCDHIKNCHETVREVYKNIQKKTTVQSALCYEEFNTEKANIANTTLLNNKNVSGCFSTTNHLKTDTKIIEIEQNYRSDTRKIIENNKHRCIDNINDEYATQKQCTKKENKQKTLTNLTEPIHIDKIFKHDDISTVMDIETEVDELTSLPKDVNVSGSITIEKQSGSYSNIDKTNKHKTASVENYNIENKGIVSDLSLKEKPINEKDSIEISTKNFRFTGDKQKTKNEENELEVLNVVKEVNEIKVTASNDENSVESKAIANQLKINLNKRFEVLERDEYNTIENYQKANTDNKDEDSSNKIDNLEDNREVLHLDKDINIIKVPLPNSDVSLSITTINQSVGVLNSKDLIETPTKTHNDISNKQKTETESVEKEIIDETNVNGKFKSISVEKDVNKIEVSLPENENTVGNIVNNTEIDEHFITIDDDNKNSTISKNSQKQDINNAFLENDDERPHEKHKIIKNQHHTKRDLINIKLPNRQIKTLITSTLSQTNFPKTNEDLIELDDECISVSQNAEVVFNDDNFKADCEITSSLIKKEYNEDSWPMIANDEVIEISDEE